MKIRKLKPAVKLSIISAIILAIVLSVSIDSNNNSLVSKNDSDYVYVNDIIFDSYTPVINQEEKTIKPYASDGVNIYKSFYEKDAEKEEQQKSLIYYEGIYMQNSGVDYQSEAPFDVLSITSGTVTNITEDALLGKTVEIKGSNELTIMYQSLTDITVKKGDTVEQGKVIGKSGKCSLYNDIKNGLHIEMYMNGSVINPEKSYNKSIKELSN